MSKYSEACCNIPPVVSDNYKPKGEHIELDGVRTYVTGSSDASTGILSIFDIFGYFPQTIQGADILSASNPSAPAQVFMPDFFNGKPCSLEWFPPDNEEKKAAFGEWFKTLDIPEQLAKVPKFLEAAEKVNPNIKSWGVIGYCWGGKMVALLGSQGEPKFKVGVMSAPAMVDVEDADKIKIPTAVLASKDENKDDIETYDKRLKVDHVVEYFGDQLHGWMSARGDLDDAHVKEEYERGYKIAANFLYSHL